MTTYLGFDLIEIAPNTRDPQEDTVHRSVAMQDPGLGDRWAGARDAAPRVARTFVWTCRTRAEILILEAFVGARRGQAVPFWIPSRRQDLLLAQAAVATDSGLAIRGMGYTRLMFPSKARRHFAFRVGEGWLLRSVTAASEGASTETLLLSASPGVALPIDILVSQLLLCRLAADEVEITYLTDSIAEASIPYIEIPQEAP